MIGISCLLWVIVAYSSSRDDVATEFNLDFVLFWNGSCTCWSIIGELTELRYQGAVFPTSGSHDVSFFDLAGLMRETYHARLKTLQQNSDGLFAWDTI